MKAPTQHKEEYRCRHCNTILGKYNATDEFFIQIKCHQRHCKQINNFGNHQPEELVEFRCQAIDPKKSAKAGHDVICNKLLGKVSPDTEINVRCPRCTSFTSS